MFKGRRHGDNGDKGALWMMMSYFAVFGLWRIWVERDWWFAFAVFGLLAIMNRNDFVIGALERIPCRKLCRSMVYYSGKIFLNGSVSKNSEGIWNALEMKILMKGYKWKFIKNVCKESFYYGSIKKTKSTEIWHLMSSDVRKTNGALKFVKRSRWRRTAPRSGLSLHDKISEPQKDFHIACNSCKKFTTFIFLLRKNAIPFRESLPESEVGQSSDMERIYHRGVERRFERGWKV